MWNNIWIWLVAQWRRVSPYINRHHGLAISIGVALLAIIFFSIRSCSTSATTTPTPGGGYFFWKIIFIGLIVSATVSYRSSPTNTKFPIYCLSGAGLVFLVILGSLQSLFDWSVLGLPLFIFGGILLSLNTKGRLQSFLGFAAGVLILFWMFLLYLNYSSKINIGFLGSLFPDDTAKVIFTIFLAVFIFATWKRSKIFYSISFIVFLSFLGNTMINQIASRYPDKLKPSIPASIAPSANKIGSAIEKKIDAFATKVDADAGKDVFSARRHSQSQKIWIVPNGTDIYSCSTTSCVPMNLKYGKPVEGISMDEPVKINDVVYEKFSLPDPATDQPGKIIGWIPTTKLSEKIKDSESEKKRKRVTQPKLIETIRISDRPFPRQFQNQLPPGKYAIEPANTAQNKSFIKLVHGDKRIEMEENTDEYSFFTVPPGEKAYCLGSDWDIIRIYALET